MKKVIRWQSKYDANEIFDTKEKCRTYDDKIKNMLNGARHYNKRKRIICKSIEDLEFAYNHADRITFTTVDAKERILIILGFAHVMKTVKM